MKQFNYVEAKKPNRSIFDLSHTRVTTMNPAYLVPVGCFEALPGSTFDCKDFESYIKTMPLISPVMHRVNLYVHAFFVPHRLVLGTDVWEDFITGKNPDYQLPSWDPTFFSDTGYTDLLGVNGLAHHLRYGKYDTSVGETWNGMPLSQMALRGYHRIWSDWYRNQNYQDEVDFSTLPQHLDVGEASSFDDYRWLFDLRKRCFEKDYFTSCLLTQQRGAAVIMPLGGSAPVSGDHLDFRIGDTGIPAVGPPEFTVSSGRLKDSDGIPLKLIEGGLTADLSSASAASISDLRQAYALQRWFEASLRFGQRYVEQLLGLFGVKSKDSRLQRSEFLAGGRLPVQIGEVLQTSETSAESPQGNMSGRGVGSGSMFSFKRTFTEHGYIMFIASCVPRTSYLHECARDNIKLNRFDFAFPQFAHLSEQPVYNQQLYQGNETALVNPFGYQPIYTEYRCVNDSVHGEMAGSLAFWTLARGFSNLPTLSEEFVIASFPQEIFAATNDDQPLLLQTACQLFAIHPLPKMGTPV